MSESRLRAAITELVEALVEDVRERTGELPSEESRPVRRARKPADVKVDDVTRARARSALRRMGVI